MSIFILFAIILVNGKLTADYRPFNSMLECEAARTVVVESAIKAGATEGSVVCTEHKIGTFS